MKNQPIKFYLNNQYVNYVPEKEYLSVLDYLRLNEELTGTKEGCGEGDCGACTVLLGSLQKTPSGFCLKYESINSCIRFLPSIHACHLVSIENLAKKGAPLHPIQEEMKNANGVQCGFCTPGIVMSIYNLFLNNDFTDRKKVEESLQGNLCRCTGYGPIVNAAKNVVEKYKRITDELYISNKKIKEKLIAIREKEPFPYSAPKDLKSFKSFIKKNKNNTIISGATDVGLWINKELQRPKNPVFINHVDELKIIKISKNFITVGSSVTYTKLMESLKPFYPELTEYLKRIGGEQIRNMGTIGGNIANASPIGDMLPPLIALKSEIKISNAESKIRNVPMEEFFIKYKVKDLKKNEFILSVKIPKPTKDLVFSNYKVSKRRDEDISSVCASFYFIVNKGHIVQSRLVFGGMAEVPKRAKYTEDFLFGKPWTEDSFTSSLKKIEEDFQPISDARASKEYRILVAKNLLRKIFLQKSKACRGLMRHEKLLAGHTNFD